MAKRELWSVFKGQDGKWKVQFPNGLMTYGTKKRAQWVADRIKQLEAKENADG